MSFRHNRLFVVLVVSLVWGSFTQDALALDDLGTVVRVEIPAFQKHVVLAKGGQYQFIATAYDAQGQTVNVPLQWKLLDRFGQETTLPGWLDQSGRFMASQFYTGPFRVVVIEPLSHISDDAWVEIQPYSPYQITTIHIFPDVLSLSPGQSAHLYIQCLDARGQVVPNFRLNYWVIDPLGRWVNDVMWIQNGGLLQVSQFAFQGPYQIYFRDANGSASTTISVQVW